MNEENKELLPPPPALISNNPLRWLRFFGPGAIVASATIASGETLFASRGGSIFGYNILWVFLLVSLLKWCLCYCSMRHMILSGGHPFERWSHIWGPRGWLPLFIFLVAAVCWPIWFGFLSGILGTLCVWIFGSGDLYWWATLCMIAGMIIVYIGNYNFLEKGQLILVGTMSIFMVIAMFYIGVDWGAAAQGMLVPQPMAYPDWLFEIKEEMRERTPWLEIIVYTSAIGGASFDYLGYLSFLRDKKWGRSHLDLATESELDEIGGNQEHTVRVWIRAALVDSGVSFAMVVFLSACFSILGTIVLQPQHLFPNDENLLNYQAEFFTTLAPWLLPFYKVAIFAAFISIIYGGPELALRFAYEYLNSLPRFHTRLHKRRLRMWVALWVLGGGCILLWLKKHFVDLSLIEFITPASIYSGVLSCGFFCLANPWMDHRFLPPALRMNRPLVILNIIAGVVFLVMGFKALWDGWDYNDHKYLAYLVLLIQMCLCMGLAHALRRHLYENRSQKGGTAR